jgi:3-oxosteroid 1-dehydrogenase
LGRRDDDKRGQVTVTDYDVVVVGTGAAGLTGALRAATRGFRVLILEKDDLVGGTAALTGGGLWAPTNTWLQQAGMEDSLEEAQRYLDSTVGDRTATWKQQAFLRSAVLTIDWLATLNVRFARLAGFPDYNPDRPGGRLDGRAIAPKAIRPDVAATIPWPLRQKPEYGDGGPPLAPYDLAGLLFGGRALVGQLLLACRDAGVDIWTCCAFRELVTHDDRVVGVLSDKGEIASPVGVLLACGGFEHNPAMREQYQLPFVREGAWSLGVAGNTGDGHRAGLALGAATDLLEDSWWTPAFERPDGPSFLLWEREAPLGFIVDQNGQRWGNEGIAYNDYGQAMRQDDARLPSYQVFDARGLSRYGFAGLQPDDDPTPWVEAGKLRRADTIEGLGIPGLAEMTTRWNAMSRQGNDEDFGRGSEGSFERQLLAVFLSYGGLAPTSHEFPNPSLAPVDEGPFYAAPVVLGDLGTKGGLLTDENGQVVREDGSTIEGLYAVGNTAASVMGHSYPGPGSCITPGMAFACCAADHMQKH